MRRGWIVSMLVGCGGGSLPGGFAGLDAQTEPLGALTIRIDQWDYEVELDAFVHVFSVPSVHGFDLRAPALVEDEVFDLLGPEVGLEVDVDRSGPDRHPFPDPTEELVLARIHWNDDEVARVGLDKEAALRVAPASDGSRVVEVVALPPIQGVTYTARFRLSADGEVVP